MVGYKNGAYMHKSFIYDYSFEEDELKINPYWCDIFLQFLQFLLHDDE